jgi:hypothetical protein
MQNKEKPHAEDEGEKDSKSLGLEDMIDLLNQPESKSFLISCNVK